MTEKSFDVFPKDPKKTYGLMELVKGTSPAVDKEQDEDAIFSWPHLFYDEFIATLLVTAVLLFLSMYINAPLEEEASKDTTPNPMKAPWYFLGLQELLVFFDPWIAGVVLPLIIIVGLMLIPYLDINPKGKGYYTLSERKFAVSTYSFGFSLFMVLIVVGVWFRGLDWNWYWPWDNFLAHKPVAVGLEDLPVILSSRLGISSFAGNAIADLLGVAYFVVGLIIPAYIFKDFYNRLGLVRYITTVTLFLMMLGVPIKIALRLVFSVKYAILTPWFKI